ncbi:MAG TPA: hypothetical protein VLZ12_07535 [Verrucomicrobiae bacterium]|nr:hypothetical protein [Verrucomicrobiae bacterium]
MKKILLWLGIGVLGLLVVLVLARNFIARKAVEVGTQKMTGFPLEIGAVNVGLLNGRLDVDNLKLMNPPEFEEKLFVDLPKLHVDYRLGSMIAGAPHINDMVINLNELVIVKNAKGESNVQKLKGVASSGSGSGSSKPAGSSGGKTESRTKYRVDRLHIHVGTVKYMDYSRGKLSERNTPLNIDATYNNITDSTDISRLVLLTVLTQVHLPDIGIKTDDLKKDLGNIGTSVTEALSGATNALDQVGKDLGNVFKNLGKQK